MSAVPLRAVIAASLLIGGASHAYLYLRSYGHIPTIGPAFLIQASVSFAVGVLVLAGGPDWLVWGAGALTFGSLGAFALSRTVGLAGFVERGWEPTPYALVSVVAEAVTVLACGTWVLCRRHTRRHGQRVNRSPNVANGDASRNP